MSLYQKLKETLPLPPVLVGIVREHHDDDTSTVELPGDLPLTGYGDGSSATGSLIRPRGGLTIPIGEYAFVRAGLVEDRAVFGAIPQVPVGTTTTTTADFTINGDTFTSTSVGATSFFWTFPDGSHSTSSTTTYSGPPGPVTLTVNGPGGTSTITKTIPVGPWYYDPHGPFYSSALAAAEGFAAARDVSEAPSRGYTPGYQVEDLVFAASGLSATFAIVASFGGSRGVGTVYRTPP